MFLVGRNSQLQRAQAKDMFSIISLLQSLHYSIVCQAVIHFSAKKCLIPITGEGLEEVLGERRKAQ